MRFLVSPLLHLCVCLVAGAADAPPSKAETVAVDFAYAGDAFTPRGAGFVRGVTLDEPGDALLRPLRPQFFRQPAGTAGDKYAALTVLPRVAGLGATVSILLAEGFDTSRGFPGENGDWARWERHVRSHAEAALKAKPATPIRWEIWPEPNVATSWKPSKTRFYTAHVRAVRIIRSVHKGAVIVGPGITWDYGWLEAFLKVAKDHDAVPDVISWTESSPRADLARHYEDAENILWQDGHGQRPILVTHAVDAPHQYSPAAAVYFLASLHRSPVDLSARKGAGGTHRESGVQLAHLLTDRTLQPRSLWWAYRSYADLSGQAVKLTPSTTLDGIATIDAKGSVAQLLLARAAHFSKPPGEKGLAPVELKFANLPWPRVRVAASRIAYSGDKPAAASAMTVEAVHAVTGEEMRVALPEFGDHDVYTVTLSPVR